MRNHTWWLLSGHMLVVQHYHEWRKPWVSSECWSGEAGKECSGWALNVCLRNPRIAWLYGPSSRPCSTLASGTTGPGLTIGSKSNLRYIKLKNLRVHDSARMALWLSPHCISYSAKIFSNLSLFLLLVTERKPWVCRATEFWGYNGAKLLVFHEIWESWWFETDSADCGIGCWFPVGFCVLRADKTTLLLLFSHRVWLFATPRAAACRPPCPSPPEFAQVHVHRISGAIQLSHPLLPSSPSALNLSQHQGLFQWVGCLHQAAKGLETS